MYGSLQGQRVLVVGGSSGIGLAVAQQGCEAGALVTIASRSVTKLDAALSGLPRTAKATRMDTADYPSIETFFAGELEWDHIVVSAAQTTSGPLRKAELKDARATMESKFWGAYHVARAAKIRDGGSLCFISGFRSAPLRKHCVAGSRKRGARGVDAWPRARVGSGPRQRGFARPGRDANVVRHGRSRARKDVRRCDGTLAAASYRRGIEHRERGPLSRVQSVRDRFDRRRRWGCHHRGVSGFPIVGPLRHARLSSKKEQMFVY